MSWCIKVLRLAIGIILFAAILVIPLPQQVPATAEVNPQSVDPLTTTNDRLGIDFISSAEIAQANSNTIQSYRYDRAVSTGIHWDRWPIYWSSLETSNGGTNTTYQNAVDATVNSDYAQGLQIDAILMNTPSWGLTALAATLADAPEPRVGEGPHYLAPVSTQLGPTSISPASTTPQNLYTSVFSDNTDTLAPGKTINPNNYWARFVYNTVSRYKTKVKVWEMWNEPDSSSFWSGSVADYYRLLKVGYLAAKLADPSSTVLIGGMAYYTNTNFFGQLLSQIKADPTAAANNYYFDATAWHWYSRSSQMYDNVVNVTRSTLSTYGLGSKPIWVNETGVPIWNDPPGPGHPYFASATLDEAASYIIQAIAYGLAANVQRIFDFQEYDDGNGEAYGLVRNNNTTRPSYTAYQVAAQYLPNYTLAQRATDGNVERIIFWGTPWGKVTVLWNTSPTSRTYSQTAAPGRTKAYLVDKAGSITNLSLASSYSIWLPGATDNNGLTNQDYIIGGSPYLLVEEVPYKLPYQTFLPQVYKNGTVH